MPRVKFIGDPRDNFSGPGVMNWQGARFVKGEWADEESGVTDAVVAKARVNTHFAVEGETDGPLETSDEAKANLLDLDIIREELARRDVDFPTNANRVKLVSLLLGSGGLPAAD